MIHHRSLNSYWYPLDIIYCDGSVRNGRRSCQLASFLPCATLISGHDPWLQFKLLNCNLETLHDLFLILRYWSYGKSANSWWRLPCFVGLLEGLIKKVCTRQAYNHNRRQLEQPCVAGCRISVHSKRTSGARACDKQIMVNESIYVCLSERKNIVKNVAKTLSAFHQ